MKGLKTVALFALLTTAGLLGVSAPPAALSPSASPAGPGFADSPATAVASPSITLPYCGDPCSVPGQTTACLDDSRGFLALVQCSCTGGLWEC